MKIETLNFPDRLKLINSLSKSIALLRNENCPKSITEAEQLLVKVINSFETQKESTTSQPSDDLLDAFRYASYPLIEAIKTNHLKENQKTRKIIEKFVESYYKDKHTFNIQDYLAKYIKENL